MIEATTAAQLPVHLQNLTNLEVPALLVASAAAFVLAVVSAVAGFGGGVLLLPVFTALFGIGAFPVSWTRD
ncbi:hypothetical protein AB2L27_20065 [Kineococcus sp. LSe6-4]|uniref:Membrane transporter protein n=1 Tax=Kineococcus halophytocola TaxID=3234027 RepID=A0ABV4H646_9ACTN